MLKRGEDAESVIGRRRGRRGEQVREARPANFFALCGFSDAFSLLFKRMCPSVETLSDLLFQKFMVSLFCLENDIWCPPKKASVRPITI